MALLTAKFVKKSFLVYNLVYLSKNCTRTNLKFFQCQVLTSVKKSEKQLQSKANFSHLFQLNCSNFKLK